MPRVVGPSLLNVVSLLMRPPGQGIPTFSAGKGDGGALLSRHFQEVYPAELDTSNPLRATELWERSVREKLASAKAVLLGVPLDTGAGIRRGAAYGPRAIREALLSLPEYCCWLSSGTLLDLGDIYVNPHLLHDEMLSSEQIQKCQDAMYASADEMLRKSLPVSALSQTQLIIEMLTEEHPHLRIFVLGGDHSIGWPIAEAMAQKYPTTLGIVQPDAHTDLLPSRLGVKYCFGTWSYHANERIGRGGKMVQLGIRQSGRDQAYWELTTGVRQYWAHQILDALNLEPTGKTLIQEIIGHLKLRGVQHIYFSNDIDGTDESFAPATGTPAPQGVPPQFFKDLIQELGNQFELVAADLVEVAPDLARSADELQRTCALSAEYTAACLRAMLKEPKCK